MIAIYNCKTFIVQASVKTSLRKTSCYMTSLLISAAVSYGRTSFMKLTPAVFHVSKSTQWPPRGCNSKEVAQVQASSQTRWWRKARRWRQAGDKTLIIPLQALYNDRHVDTMRSGF